MKRVLLIVAALALLVPSLALAQTTPRNPREVTFTASLDHAQIDSYRIGYFLAGATDPVQETDLGKPTPDATQTCLATINTQPLAFGAAYTAKIRAIAGDVSSEWSTPSNPFDRVPGPPSKPVVK